MGYSLFRKATPAEMLAKQLGDPEVAELARETAAALTHPGGHVRFEDVLTASPVLTQMLTDRHKPGYMSAYMREWRVRKKSG